MTVFIWIETLTKRYCTLILLNSETKGFGAQLLSSLILLKKMVDKLLSKFKYYDITIEVGKDLYVKYFVFIWLF